MKVEDANPDRYCTSCGSRLSEEYEATGFYNGTTGEAEYKVWMVCPKGHRRWALPWVYTK